MAASTIAIVGRPNVGKSTLFNRLRGGRKAIVDDEPGITRDRLYGEVEWGGRTFTIIDTGGFDPAAGGLLARVREQARRARGEADLVFLVVDGREGCGPADAELARVLRREAGKPVLVVVNKIDGPGLEGAASDFARLGLETVPISAEQGRGVGELLDRAAALLPAGDDKKPAEGEVVTVALVGRPNVGKSSLLNRILGEERAIVDPAPGTTRDSLDTPFSLGDRRYLLIDTAGIRAKGRGGPAVERYSVARALRSIERCDVAIVVLDASQGLVDQDVRIASLAHDAGRGLILALNKWDLAPPGTQESAVVGAIRGKLPELNYAPILAVSAATGAGVSRLFDRVDAVQRGRTTRLATPVLNALVQSVLERTPPPAWRGKPGRLRYAAQIGIRPPTFVLFVNVARAFPVSYLRFLTHRLREAAGFEGTGLRFILRDRAAS